MNRSPLDSTTPIGPQRGFTLLEILLCVAILLLSATMVGPNILYFVERSHMSADINDISSLIRFARTHAISEVSNVTICPSEDFRSCGKNWRSPLIGYVDHNGNDKVDSNESILASTQGISPSHKIKGPKSRLVFYQSGANASPASLLLCPISNNNKLARGIVISLQGRTRLTKDTNNDQIHESSPGKNIDCSLIN